MEKKTTLTVQIVGKALSEVGRRRVMIPSILLMLQFDIRIQDSFQISFYIELFFSRPSPKAGRELQTVLNRRRIMEEE